MGTYFPIYWALPSFGTCIIIIINLTYRLMDGLIIYLSAIPIYKHCVHCRHLVVFKYMNWIPWKIFRKTCGNVIHSLISSHVHNFKLAMLLVILPIIFSYKSMLLVTLKKVKETFLCSAIFSPQDCSKRFTLYFPGRPVQSNTVSTSLGSIQPYAAINARKLLVHISTTAYSQVLIYTAE